MSRMRFAVLCALLASGSLGVAGEPPSEFPVMPVGEAARLLGFRLEEMQPTVNQPLGSDIRTVTVRGQYYVVRSLRVDRNGRVVRDSLNDPQCPASVSKSRTTSLQAKPRTFRPTRNTPGLTLLSAIRRGAMVEVVYKVTAVDKEGGPLAIALDDLSLTSVSNSNRHLGRFPRKARGWIQLQPGKAERLHGSIRLDASDAEVVREGEAVRLDLNGTKGPEFDYHAWQQAAKSNTVRIRIAESKDKAAQ